MPLADPFAAVALVLKMPKSSKVTPAEFAAWLSGLHADNPLQLDTIAKNWISARFKNKVEAPDVIAREIAAMQPGQKHSHLELEPDIARGDLTINW